MKSRPSLRLAKTSRFLIQVLARAAIAAIAIIAPAVRAGVAPPAPPPPSELQALRSGEIHLNTRASLVHLGSIDSFGVTEEGKKAARLMLQAVTNKDGAAALKAAAIYHELIPKENFGGEYLSLQWIADYLLASEARRREMTADPLVAGFHDYFAKDDYAPLKEYLKRKYKLEPLADAGTDAARDRESVLEDFILFNDPRREQWEKTSKIMDALAIQPGLTIGDIGSGPGYFTFRFARAAGATGQVHAIDTVSDHLDYVASLAVKLGYDQVHTVKTDGHTIGIPPNSLDVAFMCSLYHIIYLTSVESNRDHFVRSVRNALKDGGRLVIVDNALVDDNTLPYHGPYIAKELLVPQIERYGFRLTEYYQFIPQRYVLVFEKTGAGDRQS